MGCSLSGRDSGGVAAPGWA